MIIKILSLIQFVSFGQQSRIGLLSVSSVALHKHSQERRKKNSNIENANAEEKKFDRKSILTIHSTCLAQFHATKPDQRNGKKNYFLTYFNCLTVRNCVYKTMHTYYYPSFGSIIFMFVSIVLWPLQFNSCLYLLYYYYVFSVVLVVCPLIEASNVLFITFSIFLFNVLLCCFRFLAFI